MVPTVSSTVLSLEKMSRWEQGGQAGQREKMGRGAIVTETPARPAWDFGTGMTSQSCSELSNPELGFC